MINQLLNDHKINETEVFKLKNFSFINFVIIESVSYTHLTLPTIYSV